MSDAKETILSWASFVKYPYPTKINDCISYHTDRLTVLQKYQADGLLNTEDVNYNYIIECAKNNKYDLSNKYILYTFNINYSILEYNSYLRAGMPIMEAISIHSQELMNFQKIKKKLIELNISENISLSDATQIMNFENAAAELKKKCDEQKKENIKNVELRKKRVELRNKLADLVEFHDIVLTRDYDINSNYDLMEMEYKFHKECIDHKNNLEGLKSEKNELVFKLDMLSQQMNVDSKKSDYVLRLETTLKQYEHELQDLQEGAEQDERRLEEQKKTIDLLLDKNIDKKNLIFRLNGRINELTEQLNQKAFSNTDYLEETNEKIIVLEKENDEITRLLASEKQKNLELESENKYKLEENAKMYMTCVSNIENEFKKIVAELNKQLMIINEQLMDAHIKCDNEKQNGEINLKKTKEYYQQLIDQIHDIYNEKVLTISSTCVKEYADKSTFTSTTSSEGNKTEGFTSTTSSGGDKITDFTFSPDKKKKIFSSFMKWIKTHNGDNEWDLVDPSPTNTSK